jgi:hypothetical protein
MRFIQSTLVSGSIAIAMIGCAPVAVKEVTANKNAYLGKNFSTTNISPKIASTITSADNGVLSFKKMVLTLTPQVAYVQKNSDLPDSKNTLTLINAGGPFVQRIEEQSSNTIATRQTYGLMYRNLFAIRSQTVNLNSANANPIYELKSLKSFSRLSATAPGNGELDYEYESAPTVQIVNFNTYHYHCQYLKVYSAGTLHPKFVGDAQDLDCQVVNQNGVATNHSTIAMLLHYGITYSKKIETSSYTTTFKVEDVQVE